MVGHKGAEQNTVELVSDKNNPYLDWCGVG